MNCEHNDYDVIGDFPENLDIDGECLTSQIKCVECGKIGTEYYQFIERSFD